MQAGSRSDELFDRYGGLDSLSKGSINIINYVYGYRSNGGVSAERIAALTQAKCRARALGEVSCESLPLSYTDSIGGCDPEEEQDEDGAPTTRTSTTNPYAQMPGQQDVA